MEYFPVIRGNELSGHEKTQENVKCIFTKWKKPVWKGYIVYDSNFSRYDTLEKAQLWGQWNDQWLPGAGGGKGGGVNRWSSGAFLAVKLFCVVLWWWLRVIIHFSKPTECTALRVSPHGNHGLHLMTSNGSSIVINVPHSCKTLK